MEQALSSCLSMIFLRKPDSAFRDHTLFRGRRDRQGRADREPTRLVVLVGAGDHFPFGAIAIGLNRQIPIGIAGGDDMAAFG